MKQINRNNNTIYRSLSKCENLYLTLNKVVSKNIIKGKLSINLLSKALNNLSKKYSILRCYIEEIEGQNTFVEKRKINIKNFFSLQKVSAIFTPKGELTNEINKLYEKELNSNLDIKKGLWRVLLIINGEKELNDDSYTVMILTMHHVIADGNSIIFTVREILKQLHKIKDTPSFKEKINTKKIKSIDFFLSKNIILPSINSDSSANHSLSENNYLSIFMDIPYTKKPKTIKCVSGSLSKPEFDKIKMKKKECKCQLTFTSLLYASFLKAILLNNSKITKNEYFKINCRTPLDMRRPLKLNILKKTNTIIPEKYHTDMGCYVTSIDTDYLISEETDIIKIAENINRDITDYNKIIDSIRMLLFPPSQLKKANVNISNIGIIEKNQIMQNSFKLCATDFTAANIYYCLLVSVLTYNDELHWNVLYTEPWFSKSYIKKINSAFKEQICTFFI